MAKDPEDQTAEPDLTVEELYSPDYLKDCADDDARRERLAELKRRIDLGAYRTDADSIAESLLAHGDLDH